MAFKETLQVHKPSFVVAAADVVKIGSCCVVSVGLELTAIFLHTSPTCWDYRCKPPRLFCFKPE